MITRRTKIQLLVFAIITALGVTYVGAKYAKLDRMLWDRSYTVVAHYPESGGIFAGAEVTYRGVTVGRVSELELTEHGVDVHLEIEDSWDEIPADTLALVGNRSAVGEQYVELQPNEDVDDDGPFLEDGSEITEVQTPIATEVLLRDVSETVASVDQDALRTTVEELGIAFAGSGEDLQQILDSQSSFIETADANFEVTRALIRDSNTVLQTQVDSESGLEMFARHMSSFSSALVGADQDLRRVIDSGSGTANQLRTFLQENERPLAELLNNVITTGEVVVRNLPYLEALLVAYPILLEGGFTVTDQDPLTGHWEAHIGLILTTTHPCHRGYDEPMRDPVRDREDLPIDYDARCTEPITQSNERGYQNLPRVAPGSGPVLVDAGDVQMGYDPATGRFDWSGVRDGRSSRTSGGTSSGAGGNVAPPTGEDSWKWLYVAPLLGTEE